MALVEEFLARYRREYDFYSQAGSLVAQTLDARLQAAGIRSMVTYRAKAITRLEAKCRQRALTTNYTNVEQIFDDIVDLAGVRVALYFPGERDQVDSLIKRLFVQVQSPKEFPRTPTPSPRKRFSGYSATHYRVQLQEQELSEPDRRYADARVEIQVASVLMHAWAEVEHDLVYKPLTGELSEDEYAILDELNGLVLAGEIALERLQRAGERRVEAGGRRFANHFDLAAHLMNRTADLLKGEVSESGLGRIDLLYQLLARVGLDTPDQLSPYLDALHADTDRRSISEQIIDRVLAEDSSRYALYQEVRGESRLASLRDVDFQDPTAFEQIGFFLSQWIAFEQLLRDLAPHGTARPVMPTGRLLDQLGLLDSETRAEVERLRRLRNSLVHGVEMPNPLDLREAGERLRGIVAKLREEYPTLPFND